MLRLLLLFLAVVFFYLGAFMFGGNKRLSSRMGGKRRLAVDNLEPRKTLIPLEKCGRSMKRLKQTRTGIFSDWSLSGLSYMYCIQVIYNIYRMLNSSRGKNRKD